jgi:hypothetical protein
MEIRLKDSALALAVLKLLESLPENVPAVESHSSKTIFLLVSKNYQYILSRFRGV